jgi:hypothetical protein
VFDLGYFKLPAFARLAAAQAYFLSRLNPQATLEEVGGGRRQLLDLPRSLAQETRTRVEKAVGVGARERVASSLSAGLRPSSTSVAAKPGQWPKSAGTPPRTPL